MGGWEGVGWGGLDSSPKGYLATMGSVVTRGSLSPNSLTAFTLNSYSSPGSRFLAVACVSSGPMVPGHLDQPLAPFFLFSNTNFWILPPPLSLGGLHSTVISSGVVFTGSKGPSGGAGAAVGRFVYCTSNTSLRHVSERLKVHELTKYDDVDGSFSNSTLVLEGDGVGASV